MKLSNFRFEQAAAILLFAESAASWQKFFHREIRRGAAEKLILLATNDAADSEVCDEIIKLPI